MVAEGSQLYPSCRCQLHLSSVAGKLKAHSLWDIYERPASPLTCCKGWPLAGQPRGYLNFSSIAKHLRPGPVSILVKLSSHVVCSLEEAGRSRKYLVGFRIYLRKGTSLGFYTTAFRVADSNGRKDCKVKQHLPGLVLRRDQMGCGHLQARRWAGPRQILTQLQAY